MQLESEQGKVGWFPKQYQIAEVVDLRDSGYGPRGFKLVNEQKLVEQAELGQVKSMDTEDKPGLTQFLTSSSGKKSGRSWKAPATRASSVVVKQNQKTWEKKMSDKKIQKSLLERKREAIQQFKDRAAVKRKALRAAKERKEANRKKSTVFEKITNSAKLKKLMKNKKMRRKIMSMEID